MLGGVFMKQYDAIVIGSGLAGLTAALELSERGLSVIVLEKETVIGGRTSSWDENGMIVESGFHRHIGYYKELPRVLQKAGVELNKIVQWEEKVDVRMKEGVKRAIFGMSPIYGPIALIQGIIGNGHILSIQDKYALFRMFTAGFIMYKTNPAYLDQISIKEYAQKFSIREEIIHNVITPLSTGLFFLPPERYSAKVFFGLFFPAIPRFYKMRIGAYLGGMTEVLAKPIARQIEKNHGVVQTEATVKSLLIEHGVVAGVILDDLSEIRAKHTIVATHLGGAKKILQEHFQNHPLFHTLFELPTMPAVTMQMEFSKPVLPYDRTTFGPSTCLASFTEQSRSTFRHVQGRLSTILAPADKFIDMDDTTILQHVISDGYKLGMDLKTNLLNYRVVRHPEDFYSLEPNHDWMRPEQKTNVEGLILAGDYTKQPYFATMEGAVVSGLKAANIVLDKN